MLINYTIQVMTYIKFYNLDKPFLQNKKGAHGAPSLVVKNHVVT